MTLFERDTDAILGTYNRLPLHIVRGEGVHLIDSEGRRYLDFFGGLAVNALGYGHPAVLGAIREQSERYLHLSNLFPQEPQVALAERLRDSTGYDRVYFANSGAEVMEAAFKLARRRGGAEGRTRMLAFSGAFHGRSLTALSLMDAEAYREGFGPYHPDCEILPFNDVDALRAGVDSTVSAVFLEFLQGEGGIVPASGEFIAELLRLRERYGFLLVADEIQAGMGRTGALLSFEHYGARPDLVAVAKSLGGGLPLGALLVDAPLRDVLGKGSHGSTFGGNPVACAAGCAVMDVLADGLLEHVRAIGTELRDALHALATRHPALVREVRGRGCMVGIACTRDMRPAVRLCLDRGLLINVTRGSVVRLLPPLIITSEHVRQLSAVLDEVFTHLSTTS